MRLLSVVDPLVKVGIWEEEHQRLAVGNGQAFVADETLYPNQGTLTVLQKRWLYSPYSSVSPLVHSYVTSGPIFGIIYGYARGKLLYVTSPAAILPAQGYENLFLTMVILVILFRSERCFEASHTT